jgi:hypothetical protein
VKIPASTYALGQFVKLRNKTIGEIIEVRVQVNADVTKELYVIQLGNRQEVFPVTDVICRCNVNEIVK